MEFAELIKTPKLDRVILKQPFHEPTEVTLCITSHHLILSSRKDSQEELWLLHRNVDCVERRPWSGGGLGGTLVLKCKDLLVVQLEVGGAEELNNVANSLESLSSIQEPSLQYPFFYRPMYPLLEDGWTAFQPQTEYAALVMATDEWRVSHANRDYTLCPTYPSALVVPKSIEDEDLSSAASFRQGGRFPVLSYRHEGGGVLLRSGQPLVSPQGRRCREDERLLNAVLGPGKRGYVLDTRTQAAAQAAKNKGGGFESEAHYPQWRRLHKPLQRHGVMLDSLAKLVEACYDTSATMDRWLSRLENSNWLTLVKDTLNCACLVAQCLDQEGASVLVHGSEGVDATLQVTSLAQVILNPDCRTVRGFEALIEREWLQAGHPFWSRHQRSCFASASLRTRHNAPTFLLFLDCVWQISQQFPCSFEFGESFLLLLASHSYCSQFGTFLGDSEQRRRNQLRLPSKTVSLWSYLNRPEVLQAHLNPLYEPNSRALWPSVAPMSLGLWGGLFLRWVLDPTPQKQAWRSIAREREADRELRRRVGRLRRQLEELEREAVAIGVLAAPVTEAVAVPLDTAVDALVNKEAEGGSPAAAVN